LSALIAATLPAIVWAPAPSSAAAEIRGADPVPAGAEVVGYFDDVKVTAY
jgi:hypothetical protein